MIIRRSFLSLVKGDQKGQKALSMAVMLKKRLSKSRMEHYSINKLSVILKVSPKTVNKYLPIMCNLNFVHIEGSEQNKVLIVNKLASKKKGRDISLDEFKNDSWKSIYNSLRAFIAMKIQAGKDYMKQLLQMYQSPPRGCNYKALRRKVRKLVKNGVLNDPREGYKEYGISLKRFASEVGCCTRTVQRVIFYAITNGWMTKQRHFEQVYSKNVNYRYVEGYTFTTKDNLYIIHANTYTLSPSISIAFGSDLLSSPSPNAVGW